ncbi:MAG: type II secretion system F family protein [Slackia sp.]|nr:type II secretion system F family protein [Slackia sp.]
MEGAVLLGISCIGGFVCASSAASSACRGIDRAYAAASAHAVASGKSIPSDVREKALLLARHYVRNGIPSLSRFSKAANEGSCVHRVADDAAGLLRRRGWDASCESVVSLGLASCCAVSAAVFVVSGALTAALCFPICLAAAAVIAVSRGRAREKELLREQVPDALRCMEACLHAGLSLPQAFSEVAKEAKQPLKESFAQVTRDVDLGFSMQEALERFHRNAGIEELEFVAVALDIQYACGGSATPVLHAAEDSIARGLELRRSLRVQTAQARFSAQMVGALPVFLVAVLSVVSPGFLEPFFADSRGVAMLVVAVCMQLAGIVLIRRMLSIEV